MLPQFPDVMSGTNPPRVLVIDDHPPICDWVRSVLASDGIAVTSVSSGEAALALVNCEPTFHAAICDILLPNAQVEGIAAARALWYEHSVPCLMLTSVTAAESRLAAIYAGAFGYLAKDVACAELLRSSVHALLCGERPADPRSALLVSDVEAQQLAEQRAAYVRSLEQLTPQQRTVAQLIVAGKTNQEIGKILVLSRGTVNTHVSNILQRLNLATRREVKTRVLLDLPARTQELRSTTENRR